MRKFVLMAFSIVLIGQFCFAADTLVLEKAKELISRQQYDLAIAILQNYIPENPNYAEGYLLMAQAYHWKKELYKSKAFYTQAAALNNQYRLAIIPLLDELKEWKEIIDIVEPEMRTGKKLDPSALGALATSYRQLEQKKKADEIVEKLSGTTYADQDDEDYKNYILAYARLWDGDKDGAKAKLKLIKNRAYRQYARTHEKFSVLFQDPEFLELTR